jgi:hypothetical protein
VCMCVRERERESYFFIFFLIKNSVAIQPIYGQTVWDKYGILHKTIRWDTSRIHLKIIEVQTLIFLTLPENTRK